MQIDMSRAEGEICVELLEAHALGDIRARILADDIRSKFGMLTRKQEEEKKRAVKAEYDRIISESDQPDTVGYFVKRIKAG